MKKFEYLILSVIIIGGFLVRLYKVGNPIADWHSWRQVDTASVARIYSDFGIDVLHPKYYDISTIQTGTLNMEGYRFVEFPLRDALHALTVNAIPSCPSFEVTLPKPPVKNTTSRLLTFLGLGVNNGVVSPNCFEIWGRLISIFSALITCFALFFLGRRFAGKWVGIAAAFFYAFLPFNIYFTRVILPEPMAVMFAILSVWFFSVYIDRDSKLFLFLSAITFAGGILLKPFVGFYILPMLYLAVKKYGIRKLIFNIPLILALDLALIPFFGWRIWMDKYAEGIPHYAWAFNGDGIRFRPAFWRWIFIERLGNLILGIWGLIPFSWGIITKNKKEPIFEWMLVGMFMYVTIVATANIRHDYYQTIIIPAVALVLAKGAVSMWKVKRVRQKTSKILLLFSIFLMFGASFYQVREFYKVNHPEFLDAGKAADELLPKDALVIAPDNGNTVFLYYTRRQGWPVLEEDIKDTINKGADYFVSVNKNDADTTNFKSRFETVKEGPNYIILDLHKEKTR